MGSVGGGVEEGKDGGDVECGASREAGVEPRSKNEVYLRVGRVAGSDVDCALGGGSGVLEEGNVRWERGWEELGAEAGING